MRILYWPTTVDSLFPGIADDSGAYLWPIPRSQWSAGNRVPPFLEPGDEYPTAVAAIVDDGGANGWKVLALIDSGANLIPNPNGWYGDEGYFGLAFDDDSGVWPTIEPMQFGAFRSGVVVPGWGDEQYSGAAQEEGIGVWPPLRAMDFGRYKAGFWSLAGADGDLGITPPPPTGGIIQMITLGQLGDNGSR